MGFQGGGGGGANTPTPTTNIRIPQARLEIVAKNQQELIEQVRGEFILPFRVFYDDLGSNEWLGHNPKIFLFRYKKRMKRTRNANHRPNPNERVELVGAHFAHTENEVNEKKNINRITEWDASTILPVQGNLLLRPFYKKHATRIVLKSNDWLRDVGNGKFGPRGGATKNTRFSEYFKFCYCIEKNGKILFGDLSTETIKMRVEKYSEKTNSGFAAILKLV